MRLAVTSTFLGLFLIATSTAGCGTKGPLYIPEQRYPQGVSEESNKGVENDATKKDAPAASTSAPSSPAQ